ncbi:MAG: hypothetical protein KBD31_03415 [Proteobacteria bacterium]|nr:hypothetical protein [Pseudomonadota bacterium]
MKKYFKFKRLLVPSVLILGYGIVEAGTAPVLKPAVTSISGAAAKPGRAGFAAVKSAALMSKPGLTSAAAGVRPAIATAAAIPVVAKMDDKKAQFIFKSAFDKPMFGKCGEALGKITWSSAKQLQDGGQGAMIEQHINANIMPCLAPGEVMKNPNLVKALQSSCSVGSTVTGIPAKDRLCAAVTQGASLQQQQKSDDALFPSMMNNVGCQGAKVAPFDALKLAQFVQRNQQVMATATANPLQRTQAQKNVMRALGYVADLQKCAKSQSDINFNKALAAKFTTPTCQAPVGFPNANPQLTAGIYGGPDSLCGLSKGTGVKIADNQAVEAAKKALGVPTIMGRINPAGYVGFPVGLVQPLTQPVAAQSIATWAAKDAPGFTAHFNKILAGVSSKDTKTTNPKSSALVVQACSSTLANNPNALIQQICQAANATNAQNTVNSANAAAIAGAKKTLAVPGTPLGYVGFPIGLVQPLTQPTAPQAIAVWQEKDPKGFDAHFKKILQGVTSVNGKTMNPNSSALVVQACSSSLANNPTGIIQQICQAANATNAQNGVNAQVAGFKKTLGVPMVAAQYLTCSEGFGQKLNADALSGWMQLDAPGATAHLNALNKCVSNPSSPHPKLSFAINQACTTGGVSAVPGAEGLCQAAAEKDLANTNALAESVGLTDVTGMVAGQDAVVQDLNAIDPNAIDPNAIDPNMVDPSMVDPSMVDPNMVDPSMVDPSMVDPSMVDPNMVDPNMIDPNMIDPNMIDPNMVDPNMVDPNMIDPNTVDPNTVKTVDMENVQDAIQFMNVG